MAKPVILIIPGAWQDPSSYSSLVSALESLHYEVHISALRTASRRAPQPAASLNDDVKHFQSMITNLAEQGKDIVVFAHSYAGLVSAGAVKDVTKNERAAAGLKGGVTRIIHLTALVPKKGDHVWQFAHSYPGAPGRHDKAVGEYLEYLNEEIVLETFFTESPRDKALEAVRSYTPQSFRSFYDPVEYAGYATVPSSYILCDKDKGFPPVAQQWSIDTIEASGAPKVDVAHIDGDHCPYIGKAEELAKITQRLIEQPSN